MNTYEFRTLPFEILQDRRSAPDFDSACLSWIQESREAGLQGSIGFILVVVLDEEKNLIERRLIRWHDRPEGMQLADLPNDPYVPVSAADWLVTDDEMIQKPNILSPNASRA